MQETNSDVPVSLSTGGVFGFAGAFLACGQKLSLELALQFGGSIDATEAIVTGSTSAAPGCPQAKPITSFVYRP